jgi:hypothetical protein
VSSLLVQLEMPRRKQRFPITVFAREDENFKGTIQAFCGLPTPAQPKWQVDGLAECNAMQSVSFKENDNTGVLVEPRFLQPLTTYLSTQTALHLNFVPVQFGS